MKKGIAYFVIVFSILAATIACERDDICVDAPITPFMSIAFQNNDPNFNTPRVVTNLQVTLIENDSTVFTTPISEDTIRIPLNTLTNRTVFQFTRNVGDANVANTATDTLSFSYTTENVFVNRACGFKTFYNELSAEINEDRDSLDTSDNNWIQRLEIINTTINDEPNTHIRLFH